MPLSKSAPIVGKISSTLNSRSMHHSVIYRFPQLNEQVACLPALLRRHGLRFAYYILRGQIAWRCPM